MIRRSREILVRSGPNIPWAPVSKADPQSFLRTLQDQCVLSDVLTPEFVSGAPAVTVERMLSSYVDMSVARKIEFVRAIASFFGVSDTLVVDYINNTPKDLERSILSALSVEDALGVGGGDFFGHWDSEISRLGSSVLTSFSARDSTDVYSQQQPTGGVPNHPNFPETNGKCRWNGGAQDCFPAFDGGDVDDFDAALVDPGYAQTLEIDRARLHSAAWDPYVEGVRLIIWDDRGSSIQFLQIGTFSQSSPESIYFQFDMMVDSTAFFVRSSSDHMKLQRLHRAKIGGHNEERAMDWRVSQMDASQLRVRAMHYVSPLYGETGERWMDDADCFVYTPSNANTWFRLTLDWTPDGMRLRARNRDTDSLVHDELSTAPIMCPEGTLGAVEYDHTNHSTSHDPDLGDPNWPYWVNNYILSTEPINP